MNMITKNQYLSYETASENNMTYEDVIKFYKPHASDEEISQWLIEAENDCLLKHLTLDGVNVVPAIYYVGNKFL